MSLRSDLRAMLEDLDEQYNAASQLWTWLPSYDAAKRHHGDYAFEFMPSPADVMLEACEVFAARQQGEAPKSCECPCGEEEP